MSSTEIKYFFDNQEKIYEDYEKIQNIIESLPQAQEILKIIEESFEDGNIEKIYSIINNIYPNSSITLSTLKLLFFLEYTELKDKLFSNEEYTSLLKDLVDMYGNRLSEIINIKSIDFNVSDLDPLLSFDDPKYSEAYKSIFDKKLTSAFSIKDAIGVLKNCNIGVVKKELIISFLENFSNSIDGIEAIEFLKALPSSILQDGTIAKTIVAKNNYNITSSYEEILDYIPSSACDLEFIKKILDNSYGIPDKIFDYIPPELRTREIWERVCNIDRLYLNRLPNNNIDPNISQEEYTSWVEDLITRKITEYPEDAISNFNNLDDSKKTVTLCQKVAESITIEKYKYNDLLKSIPESSRTQQLYETLVSKSPRILRDIPLQSFVPNISQEEYDKWVEDLILKSISTFSAQDMDVLSFLIPREKINERIWNEFLDKCIAEKVKRSFASLEMVNFENMTPQMVERAMKEIGDNQLYYVPCIDQKLDDLYVDEKGKYAKWQASFTEEQKQAYRTWYEQIWIKYINEIAGTYEVLYSHVPKEGITTAMNKACIDINYRAIYKMPLPETEEQLKEYQKLLIYALGKTNGEKDILEEIPKEYINEEVVRSAIEKSIVYLTYADHTAENFSELIDIAYKHKLSSMGRTRLTEQEHELMQKFILNNAELFKTLQLEILDPKIVSAVGESSLEKITRYGYVQYYVINIAKDESAIKTFGFALENLKMGNIFIEPLIEKLSESIGLSLENHELEFLNLVSQRIDRKDIPFTDYEKAIIPYLALNRQENHKIRSYDEILTFVERKNRELESIINNENSTLLEVKNAYLERIVGLNYNTVVNLITTYGNDPEQLLQNYRNVSPESFKELGEKEALEIIIKLKSLIETQDIDAIRSEFHKNISKEIKEESFIRYQKSTILETSLRRAYGRDMVNCLSKNVGSFQVQELEFEGEKYIVRKLNGEFNRMVSLLGAYRKSSTTEGDMYDRWNTNQMANNHALCYSLINQSNPGTAMVNNKSGIIISINGFSPESILAAAPYDLCSDNRKNTISTRRQQRFFSAQNMPNQTRGLYSEYDIEIQDVLSESDKYKKIQPATIICFEEVDEDSIRAAIELGKKLGHPVPIELIDRRELARTEMMHIIEALNKFKNGKTIDPTLVREIITRFNNVRTANIVSDLSDELVGENKNDKSAPFNIEHLNQILKECLATVEQRIRSGKVKEGLEALESIKMAIYDERQKSFLMPTMYKKQLWTGIDMDIDYALDELQRTYGQQTVKPLEKIKTLETLSQMQGQDLSSVIFEDSLGEATNIPKQLSADQIMQIIDISKIEKGITEIHSQGFYQKNKSYDEEHIARVILYSDAISKMEGFDDKTRELLTEAAKYYSCGRQLDTAEKHEQYSAKLTGKVLAHKYSPEDLGIIQATIEFQNFKPNPYGKLLPEEEKKAKLEELCNKYGISEEKAVVISKMSSCISDAVKLDQTRFVDKTTEKEPEQSFKFASLKSESAKKMTKFSYSIQELLAQQELDRLSSVVQINFDAGWKQDEILKDFFTAEYGRITKKSSITKSPIVRLEYLKTKYPELVQMYLDELPRKKQSEVVVEETKSPKEKQIQDLSQQQFEAWLSELVRQIDPVLVLDKLSPQQEIIQQQSLEDCENLETHHKRR